MTESFARWVEPVADNPDPVLADKLAMRLILSGQGWPHAATIAVGEAPDIIDHVRPPCVLKPRAGAAAVGCAALTRWTDGRWHDQINGRIYDRATLIRRMRRVQDEYPEWGALWIVEELIVDDGGYPAPEYKAYTFGGTARLYLARVARGGRLGFRWWDERLQPVTVGKHDDHIDPAIPAPSAAVRQMAEAVAARFPAYPFLRVDIFAGRSGPVVGELADHIGDWSFNSEWDRRLGVWWWAAIARRMIDRSDSE